MKSMIKSYLKTGLTDRLQIVKAETGEVLDERVKTYKYLAKSKEEFYIVYTALLGVFKKLNNPEIKTYCHLLENCQVGSDIAITNKLRVRMGKELKLNPGTIANALGTLTEKKLIYSIERGIYKLNPRYAYQGPTAERNKLLKLVLELECPDC